ncbi:MAG TPA: outer membrane beta-barrel protein, partial [Chitinophagaceae bacterium]|nr:outer membrane beta-barrel protein [Chitinophagaceae bacterium]
MKKTGTFVVFLFISLAVQAQRGSVKVSVVSDQQAPLENATVEVVKKKDSSLVKAGITDKTGLAEIDNIRFGDYLLRVSMINCATIYSSSFSLSAEQSSVSLPNTVLSPKGGQLGEVTVTARKPFIQKLSDRIVVNVENSIVSAGSSALDVLERSPGVNVDNNDAISLRGRSGVIIMIDGKPTAMSGADLANYLRGLPSAAIERIDIITNPSAKYDASGNSGIIDIRMKKDQRLGTNGTFTAGYGQGVYTKANAGTTFNYRNKKVNVFGNYNYAYRIGLNHLYLDRNFYTDNGVYNGGDLKDNYNKPKFGSHTARVGADFFPNKKTIVGFVVNTNFNHFTRRNDNNSIVINNQKQQVSTFNSLATNNDHGNNIVANANLKHTFDSTGKEITADIDYGRYNSGSITHNATSYYKLDGTSLQPNYVLDGDQDGKLQFTTIKSDYINPLKKKAKLEAGFKLSFVSSDNDAKFFDVSNGTPQNDVSKTNHFYYKENNNAGYINFSRDFKKFDIQFGLRGEQTNIKTRQVIGNVQFDSSYFQLFPSAFFNYKLKEDQTLGVSVSRRIDRPGYGQLNPFLFLIDVTTYATGRPGLLPQFTWSYELSYTVKNLSLTFGYSHSTNSQNIAIAKFKDVFPNIPSEDNVTVQIPINLSSSDYYGLTIAAPIRISKWWNMINNANMYYQKFNGSLGMTQLNKGKPAADIRTNNSFAFKKGWTAELNASLSSGGQYGFMVTDPQWALSTGV